MKGPYERLKYDLRRVWECPVCGHKERTGGAVTAWLCGCQKKEKLIEQKWMRLVEDGPRRTASVLPKPNTQEHPSADSQAN